MAFFTPVVEHKHMGDLDTDKPGIFILKLSCFEIIKKVFTNKLPFNKASSQRLLMKVYIWNVIK